MLWTPVRKKTKKAAQDNLASNENSVPNRFIDIVFMALIGLTENRTSKLESTIQ